MSRFSNLACGLGLALSTLPVPAGAAQEGQAPSAWKHYESSEACSLGGQARGAFVFLSINPEGEAMLRIHHPEMAIGPGESRTGILQVGAQSFGLSVVGARSTDGTPGFTARMPERWREVLEADGEAVVMVPMGKAIPLDLAGLDDAMVKLNACTARLKPRDPSSIVTVKPKPIRMPAITPAQLPLGDAVRREVGFRLTVSREGRAENCEITRSSGADALDAKVCQLLIAGTRFEPAKNIAGNPVIGTYQSRVVF